MERLNDILRRVIDRFVGISALIFRLALHLRLVTYAWQQRRLRRRYRIQADTPVNHFDDLRLDARETRAAYAYTSGTTQTPKRISYDRQRVRKTLLVFVSAMFRHLAAWLPSNRTFFVLSPLRPDRSLTTLLLVDKGMPPYLCGLQAPHRVQKHPAIQAAAELYGETAVRLWLLTTANPGLIYATNPSTIATFLEDLHSNWAESRRLVRDYVRAASELPVGLQRIHRRIVSRGARARMSRIASSQAPLPVAEMFPGLRSFSCWDGGYVRPFVEQIRRFLPEANYLHLPMYSMSTETIETIRVDSEDSSAFLPIAPDVLYEFIGEGSPDSPECLLQPGQLTTGGRYSLVVSDPYGLRRYQTEDIFECVGNVRGLPDLRFVKRRNLSYSFTGEKLTAEQLKLAYREAENRFPDLRAQGILTCFPSFSVADAVPRYRLVLVRTSADNTALPGDLAAVVENKLCEFNSEYESKVESRRLGRMTFAVTTAGEFVRTLVGAGAASESQFKFMPLYPRLWESMVNHD